MNYEDYKIVSTYLPQETEDKVEEYLKKGYILVGGLQTSSLKENVVYSQALAKLKPTEVKNDT